jgi:hypothetical protein
LIDSFLELTCLLACVATRTTGAVLGVIVGCLLGMIPLLFFDGKSTAKENSCREEEEEGEKKEES